MRTEKEKMLAGDHYLSADPEIVALAARARSLLERFNASSVREPEVRFEILTELFGFRPKNVRIEPPFHCDFGDNISIGEDVLINFGCKILDASRVEIGDRVLIAPNVGIYAATHPLEYELRRRGLCLAKPITIGDDCWIGGSAVILPGVRIGARTVVGAGAVVTRDLPSDVLVVGNPARIVRHLDGRRSPQEPARVGSA